MLPAMAFENLNSLETLSIQNNKLTTIPGDVVEPIIDTLRVVDIMGEFFVHLKLKSDFFRGKFINKGKVLSFVTYKSTFPFHVEVLFSLGLSIFNLLFPSPPTQ